MKTWLYIALGVGVVTGQPESKVFDPEQVLSGMTLEEKAAQMIIVYNPQIEYLQQFPVGGIIIFKNMIKDSASIAAEVKQKQKAMKIPLLVCIDQEGGQINRLGNLPKYRETLSARQLAEVPDDSVRMIAEDLTRFLNSIGINTNFAPCLDPATTAAGDSTYMAIRHRSFGDDGLTITRKGMAFTRGIRQQNGFSILKHFPGYDVNGNSDLNLTISPAKPAALDRCRQPFKEVMVNSDGLMMSNIIYKNLDSLPAVLSAKVVGQARRICGDKLIITDDLWAVSVRQVVAPDLKDFKTDIPDGQFARLVEMAVRAGNDMLLITHQKKVPVMVQAIVRLAQRDTTRRKRIDESVRRILEVKQLLR